MTATVSHTHQLPGQLPEQSTALPAGTTAAQILENVRALGDLIEAEACAIDAAGRLTPTMLAALRAAGVFRVAWPAAWGGPQMRFDDQVRMVESLAYHDASVAWNVQILTDSGFYAGQLREDVARELYPSMDLATAGGFFPPAPAHRVASGWRVSGTWPFGSGIHSADRIVCGVHLFESGEPLLDAEGEQEFRVAYLPQEQVELLDTWDVTGLRGSGSTHYRVEDVVVPDERMFTFFSVGGPDRPPLSRYPDMIGLTLQGVVLGIARRFLDDTLEVLRVEGPHDRFTRVALAEAETLVGSARAYSLSTAGRVSDLVLAGRTPSDRELAEAGMAVVNAGHAGQQAIERACELLGSRVIYNASAFERRRRDALTLLSHIGHQRRSLEVDGGKLLGEAALPRLA